MIDLNYYSVIDYTIDNYSEYCSNFSFDLKKRRNLIHQPGFHNCFLHKDKKIILMHIDKCASSSIKLALKNANICDMSNRVKNVYKLKKYFLKNNYRFYSVIREPRSRYISGLQEFIKRYNPTIEYIKENLKNSKFIFDEHTAPQHCFLFLCDDKCNYLKLDKKISNKISNLFERDLIMERKNQSVDLIKNQCKKFFKEYCLNNEKFDKLYEKDFILYDLAL